MKSAIENKSILKNLPKPGAQQKGWPWTEETAIEIYKDIKSFPKISIITPSFNQGEFIEQTIRSVLLQNYPNLEYIIIDGGSTDNTIDIISKYSPWLKYWVSEKDTGQSNAINKGLLNCEGEIFNWINSDDFYNKECFKYLAENFNDQRTEIVAGKYRFFFEHEDKEKIIDFKLRSSVEESIALVAINQPSTFYRLKIFKDLGGLDERLNFLMDQDVWKKYLFKHGQDKIKILSNELVNFRYHSASKTSQYKFMNEYIGIFYSIAQKAGMHKHAELLRKVYGKEIGRDYDFKFNFSKDNIKLAKRVINSLVLFNAKRAYSSNEIESLNLWLSVLEKKWLNEEQKNYTLALKVKAKLIKYNLRPVLKLINKRNNNSKLKRHKESI